MKRISAFLLSGALCTLALYSGCKEDDKASLTGTYGRMYQVGTESYPVELRFTSGGELHWTPLDSIPGHTASVVKYELKGEDQFRIYDDPDCGDEATYSHVATNDALTLTAVSDACDPRKEAMSGQWDRK